MLIGIDIGGTKILTAASDHRLAVKRSQKFTTPASSDDGLDQIIETVEALVGRGSVEAIGVAAVGPLDLHRGIILNPPNLAWRNVPVKARLEQHFKVPVKVDNDANAAGLAEAKLGAAQGCDSVLYVTISTGVGTGIILNGEVYHGAFDSEGGHITLDPDGPQCSCGGQGHLEAYVSGRALKRRFGRAGYEIKDAKTWDIIAHDIAWGLASMSSLISPERIVLGGGVSVHYRRFHRPLERYYRRFVSPLYPPSRIVVARHTEDATVLGALILAQQAARQNA